MVPTASKGVLRDTDGETVCLGSINFHSADARLHGALWLGRID